MKTITSNSRRKRRGSGTGRGIAKEQTKWPQRGAARWGRSGKDDAMMMKVCLNVCPLPAGGWETVGTPSGRWASWKQHHLHLLVPPHICLLLLRTELGSLTFIHILWLKSETCIHVGKGKRASYKRSKKTTGRQDAVSQNTEKNPTYNVDDCSDLSAANWSQSNKKKSLK